MPGERFVIREGHERGKGRYLSPLGCYGSWVCRSDARIFDQTPPGAKRTTREWALFVADLVEMSGFPCRVVRRRPRASGAQVLEPIDDLRGIAMEHCFAGDRVTFSLPRGEVRRARG